MICYAAHWRQIVAGNVLPIKNYFLLIDPSRQLKLKLAF